jgi:hypothetical protein
MKSDKNELAALAAAAGKSAKKATKELTRHPDKAAVVAAKFRAAAEYLDAGDVLAATDEANTAMVLLEIIQALLYQDRIEQLRDPKCGPKRQAEGCWRATLKPSTTEAQRLATHFREHRLHYIPTTPPYEPPAPAPKVREKVDGTRYLTVFEAVSPQEAEKHALPVHLEFKHGVNKFRGFMMSVADAVNRKTRGKWPGDWSVTTTWEALSKVESFGGLRYTWVNFSKNEYDGKNFHQFHLRYRIVSTTHEGGQEDLKKRDGKVKKPVKP